MYKNCIICESTASPIELNDLPMMKCSDCGLIWRRNFDICVSHYETSYFELGESKIASRVSNVRDRIKTLKTYLNFNNLCDVGSGEGTFLEILSNLGFKNLWGVEPNIQAANFAKNKDLNFIRGTIKDVGRLISRFGIHTITLFHLIEHLREPHKDIKMLSRQMGSGDAIVIETPDINCYSIKKANYRHKLIYPEHLFYFNERNIRLMLENAGFFIIAQGKRDFVQLDASLRELFFKLGLRRDNLRLRSTKQIGDKISLENTPRKNRGRWSLCLYKILSVAVRLLGRSDYVWIVARKM